MTRRRGVEGLEELAEHIRRRLLQATPGGLSVLNSLALRATGGAATFPQLVVRDPLLAFRLARESRVVGDPRFIFYNILVGLGAAPSEAWEAVEALARGDPGPFQRLLEALARRLHVRR